MADEGSSCADIRMAWESLCAAAAQGPEASGAISDEPRDENSAPILGAAQGDSARGPLDAILQSLEEICSQLEEAPGGHAPVMLPDAGEAASRLNPRCARSQPSSPRVRAKPQLPAYLTLARRTRHDDALEIEQIKTILASIDFSRYRKKRGGGALVDEGRTAMSEQAALQGSRLRELTEKLKSPVGAPGRPSESWNRRPAPVCRSASFSTSDLPSVPTIPRESLTLPRKAPASRPLTGRGGARDAARVALDDVAMSSLSLDSAVESIVDETPYQREASPPAAAAADKRRVQRGCRFAPLDDDGSRGPPQPPEKRKRRKGLAPVEGPKKETGRSLTYPPQRKTAEQELAFGSVDSNGLKALGGRPEKQPSDLSLADSHFCPSEALGEETFGDVVQSLSSRPEQPEPRQEKSQKKKHLSDPSADNTGAATELLLGACCRSEPQLSCPGALHKRQHSGPAALSRTPVPAPPPPPPLSDSERATSDTERTCSPQRRYSKKRLRGPYGEMLEQEMRKTGEKQKTAFCEELSFLLPAENPAASQTSPAVPATTPATTSTTTTCGGAKLIATNAPTMAARSRPAHLSNSLSLDDTQLKSSTASLEAVPEASAPRRKISANYPLTGSDTASLLVCHNADETAAAGKAQPVSWLTAGGADSSARTTPTPSPVPPSPQLSGAPERVAAAHHERSHSSPATTSDGSPLLVRTGSLRRHQVSTLTSSSRINSFVYSSERRRCRHDSCAR